MDSIFPKHFETPFFLLDEQLLSNDVVAIQTALKQYWDNYRVFYSVKTNSLPALAILLKEKGVGAEVVSKDEFDMVRAMGYTSKEVICNGPVKQKDWVELLLDEGVLLNIDSHRELHYISAYAQACPDKYFTVGLRVNPDIEYSFPGESKGGRYGSRFGFSEENGELAEAIEMLMKCPNVKINGLHLHISTKNRRCEIYRWLVRVFASIVSDYSLSDIQYLDIGGGFYGGLPGKPTWNDYAREISDELVCCGFYPERLTLILEPGVSLLAGCFSYYASVVDVRNTARQVYVVCDGSRIHIDPLMHKESYFYRVIRNNPMSEVKPVQRLAGFTCLENDCFFDLFQESELSEGDIIRFDRVGAYTLSLSPLFISYFPAVYMKHCDGDISCLREKWNANEFLQLSKRP